MTVSEPRGRVYVVSTPIGNLEDLSPRALRVLREADLIACEDTRRTGRLCTHFGVSTRRLSLHAHNEERRLPELLRRLAAGAQIALVSDAGTPLLSDPGARLVRAALAEGHEVIPVPGPSAILAALVASGLDLRPFSFVGFLPRKGRARSTWLERLRELPGTLVLFEAPGRVSATLSDLHAALGPRPVVVARELTKRFEQVWRGRLGEPAPIPQRGEFTLVIGGPEAEASLDPTSVGSSEEPPVAQRAAALLARGFSPRDAARELAEQARIPRSQAYREVLAALRAASPVGRES
ncbi:MAG: 16S rRNA (cytidine(1402)-2'-O)-methyltransferase [Myxococcota bacterium]